MQRPGWSTIVAILMILIGGCGSVNDIKQIKIDEVLEFQDDLLHELSVEIEIDESISDDVREQMIELSGDTLATSSDSLSNAELLKSTIMNMSQFSDTDIAKMKRDGYIGLPISVLFIIVGILFFSKRKYMLHMSLITIAVGILFSVYQLFDLGSLGISKLLKVGLQMNLAVGVFLSFVVIIILLMADKSYYLEEKEFADYFDE